MGQWPEGTQPFLGISPHEARKGLRALLADVGVPNAERYWCHDLRRGHAEDLRRGGATLAEILRAGDWKSPAFLAYLDIKQLELDRTCEVHLEDSEIEEEGVFVNVGCRMSASLALLQDSDEYNDTSDVHIRCPSVSATRFVSTCCGAALGVNNIAREPCCTIAGIALGLSAIVHHWLGCLSAGDAHFPIARWSSFGGGVIGDDTNL